MTLVNTKLVFFVSMFALLSGCEREAQSNSTTEISDICSSEEIFVKETRSLLLAAVDASPTSSETYRSRQTIEKLLSAIEIESQKIVSCQAQLLQQNKAGNCEQCLNDLYMDVQGVYFYLSKLTVGKRPILDQDKELIRLQLE
jgi:isochorismate synthase EntC